MHDFEQTEATKHDASRALNASVVSILDTWLRQHALQGLLKELCDGSVSSSAVGWPRLVAADAIGSWLRASDVAIEVATAPGSAAFEAALILHAESATRWVERLLGAPTESGAASLHGGPSEAECGLLAYFAARVLRARGEKVVREVRRGAIELRDPTVVWPISLTTSFGVFPATLLLSRDACERIEPRLALGVRVRDRADRAHWSGSLAVGDVIVSDEWLLSAGVSGIAGPVLLTLEGTSTCFRGHLAEGRVTALREAPPAAPDELELVLAERPVSFLEAAEGASGIALPLSQHAATVRLVQDGRTHATGELVRYRGAIGMRVTSV